MSKDNTDVFKPSRPKNPTFRSFQEVMRLPEFKENNYFRKEDYRRVLHDYVGQNVEFHCCLIKRSGSPCKQKHKWGYIVQLGDESFSLVGHNCVFADLESDHKALQDIREFRRKREYDERLAEITEEFSNKAKRSRMMKQYLNDIDSEVEILKAYRNTFGGVVYDNLVARAKSSDAIIRIEGVKITKYKDESGQEKKEERRVPHLIGNIKGLNAFSVSRISEIKNRIKSTSEFYDSFSVESITESSTQQFFVEVLARLREYHKFEKEVKEFSNDVDNVGKNNLLNLIYLDKKMSSQARLCREHFGAHGKTINKLEAKQHLNKMYNELVSNLGVTYLDY